MHEPVRLTKEPEEGLAHSHLKLSAQERTLQDDPLHDIQNNQDLTQC